MERQPTLELMERLLTRLEREGIENEDTRAARELITTDYRDPLYTAAPDLLAALETMVEMAGQIGPPEQYERIRENDRLSGVYQLAVAVSNARAVIAKAKGGA